MMKWKTILIVSVALAIDVLVIVAIFDPQLTLKLMRIAGVFP
ncbi:MAG TPA: hypothetical protein VKU79_06560 [Thermoplasmataceae archaeon]|nr:hypothetical protein [Thermoplasmataceae archaeon]